MKRKDYMTPTTLVVILQQQSPLLNGSPQGSLDGDDEEKKEDWN